MRGVQGLLWFRIEIESLRRTVWYYLPLLLVTLPLIIFSRICNGTSRYKKRCWLMSSITSLADSVLFCVILTLQVALAASTAWTSANVVFVVVFVPLRFCTSLACCSYNRHISSGVGSRDLGFLSSKPIGFIAQLSGTSRQSGSNFTAVFLGRDLPSPKEPRITNPKPSIKNPRHHTLPYPTLPYPTPPYPTLLFLAEDHVVPCHGRNVVPTEIGHTDAKDFQKTHCIQAHFLELLPDCLLLGV